MRCVVLVGVIGFSGGIGSGKSTVARLLASRVPGSEVFSFGDALKVELWEFVNGVRSLGEIDDVVARGRFEGLLRDVHDCGGYGDVSVKNGAVRRALQFLGTDVRRVGDPDYWVDRLFCRVRNSGCRVAVVDDVRFVNEADAVVGAPGVVFRLDCSVSCLRERSLLRDGECSVVEHSSEHDIDGYGGFVGRFDAGVLSPGEVVDGVLLRLGSLGVDWW